MCEKASRSYLNTDSYIQLLLAPHTLIYRADQLSLEERRNALNLQKEENKKLKKDKEKDKDKKRKKSKKKEHSACSSRQDIEFNLRFKKNYNQPSIPVIWGQPWKVRS